MPKQRMRQLISVAEAIPVKSNLKKPCSDCPWSRNALPGWLGSMTADEWITAAHSETLVDCHAFIGPQCAGIAIYRANVLKRCRDASIQVLRSDKRNVFATPNEFREHHEQVYLSNFDDEQESDDAH